MRQSRAVAVPKTRTIRGNAYPVDNIDGKPYAEVHTRVEAAHANGGYSVESREFKVIAEWLVCEVWITVPGGQRFPGTAMVPKSFSRPLEKAETSAIGRALAFAGFNIETAIASREDIESVNAGEEAMTVEADLAELAGEPRALPDPYARLSIGELAKQLQVPYERLREIQAQCRRPDSNLVDNALVRRALLAEFAR